MAKKKKQNNKRRLLLLILLLVCAIVLLGGATYAWFTANTKVSIEEMELEVTVANGIEISADAVHWGARITLDDLYAATGKNRTGTTSQHEQAGSVNMFPDKMKNVSTIGNINTTTNRIEFFNGVASNVCEVPNPAFDENQPESDSNKRTFTKGVVSDDYSSGDGGVEVTECDPNIPVRVGLVKAWDYKEGNVACWGDGSYKCTKDANNDTGVIAFDIYLKLDNDSTVSLAPTSSYIKNNSKTDYGLKNTIRAAFVTLGTQPSDFYFAPKENYDNTGVVKVYDDEKSQNVQYAKSPAEGGFGGYAGKYGARNMNAFGSIHIWEPNSTSHTDEGLLNATNNYNRTVTGPDKTHGIYSIETEEGTKIPLPMYLNHANDSDHVLTEENYGYPEYFAEQKGATSVAGAYKNKVGYRTEETSELDESYILFSAPAGVTKVRVYIWVEGQDIDTENNATSSKISALFSFTTADTNPDGVGSGDFETYTRTTVANNWNKTVVDGSITAVMNPLTDGTHTGS